jgi:hypothetical protein
VSGIPINCAGTGQDGEIQAGVPFPTLRFTDNSSGTVRDNLTGLIWLKNANCFGGQTWGNALSAANNLADDPASTTTDCGLPHGSVASDWRLPNIKELQCLIDFGFFSPALSNAAGTAKRIIAANDSRDRGPVLAQLRQYLEWFKVLAQLCQESGAFASTRAYLHVAEQIVGLAKQNEGWLRQTATGRGRRAEQDRSGEAGQGRNRAE